MKRLIIDSEIFEAEKIIKAETSIIGYVNNKEVFAFRGVNDFTQFQLEESQEWDIAEEELQLEHNVDLDYRLSLIEMGLV